MKLPQNDGVILGGRNVSVNSNNLKPIAAADHNNTINTI